jgi:hypothetical protein
MTRDDIIEEARKLCEKFVRKVESGQARSRETYFECQELLKHIHYLDFIEPNPTRAQRFVRHIAGHLQAGDKVVCKICGKTMDEICKE